jgi:hypothetical protein
MMHGQKNMKFLNQYESNNTAVKPKPILPATLTGKTEPRKSVLLSVSHTARPSAKGSNRPLANGEPVL